MHVCVCVCHVCAGDEEDFSFVKFTTQIEQDGMMGIT